MRLQETIQRKSDFVKPKIFVVEDDAALQELYMYSLESEFECHTFEDGLSFQAALKSPLPDLIILDVMLPGDDGFTILNRLKADSSTDQIPIIMVSAKEDEISRVKGLNMGADDYIGKPFGVLELIARIKANLRRNEHARAERIAYKDLVIDYLKHGVFVADKQIQTTLKEYTLLTLLCENVGRVQTRETIYNDVWGDTFIGETRTLDIHIKELRKKLAEAESEVIIQTIRGVGYLLL